MASNALKKVNGTQQFRLKVKYDDGTSEILNNFSDVQWILDDGGKNKSTVDPEGNVVCKTHGLHKLYAKIGSTISNVIKWEVQRTIKSVAITTIPNEVLSINNPQTFEAKYTYDTEEEEIATSGKWEVTAIDEGDGVVGAVASYPQPDGTLKLTSTKAGKMQINFKSKEGFIADPVEYTSVKEIIKVNAISLGSAKPKGAESDNNINYYYGILVSFNDGSSEWVDVTNPDSKYMVDVQAGRTQSDTNPALLTNNPRYNSNGGYDYDFSVSLYNPDAIISSPEDTIAHENDTEDQIKRRAIVCRTTTNGFRKMYRQQNTYGSYNTTYYTHPYFYFTISYNGKPYTKSSEALAMSTTNPSYVNVAMINP